METPDETFRMVRRSPARAASRSPRALSSTWSTPTTLLGKLRRRPGIGRLPQRDALVVARGNRVEFAPRLTEWTCPPSRLSRFCTKSVRLTAIERLLAASGVACSRYAATAAIAPWSRPADMEETASLASARETAVCRCAIASFRLTMAMAAAATASTRSRSSASAASRAV